MNEEEKVRLSERNSIRVLRMECLKLALTRTGDDSDVLARAIAMEAFVLHGVIHDGPKDAKVTA